jgi:hypothetical protein
MRDASSLLSISSALATYSAANFRKLCLRLVITDILGAAIGSADQATDGGLPDPARQLAAS